MTLASSHPLPNLRSQPLRKTRRPGASGDGGSSYVDLVAFRERDANIAWTSASDGTLEERLYYCQNQHADVVALITAAGAQREMARYSAYGVPFGLPVGDTNSDGDCDQADQNQVRDWALATPAVYDVRGDLDLDGDVDLTDRDTLRDNYKGVTLGRGVLSAPLVANRFGQAGHVLRDGAVQHARARLWSGALGTWWTRDPGFDRYPQSLYQVCALLPSRYVDPTGREPQDPRAMSGGHALGEHLAKAREAGLKELNPDERELVRRGEINDWDLLGYRNARNVARAAEKRKYGRNDVDDRKGNAFLHCVFACETADRNGESKARKLLDAHESGSTDKTNRPDSTAMDLHNNEVGIECAKNGVGFFAGLFDDCRASCESCCECREGSLITVAQIREIRTTMLFLALRPWL